ncbi:MAG TPA: Rieske (2Fe-2S) protein [Armatimonadaceae bacterium]|nr:Rieske (2Fe-2S) protein [Armatimonadaceae bacterium]
MSPATATTAAAAADSAAEAAGPPDAPGGFVAVAPVEEVRRRGVVVVRGEADRPIAVFAHGGEGEGISAVDNRCPHMGFPLSRGTVRDGILTCHWHQARFDLCSGCTFDLFADDVPAYDVAVRDGWVFVARHPRRRDAAERYRRRLTEGMEQNVALIQAKGVIGLLREGVDYREIVRQVARFGARNRDGWSGGMTSLTALANLVPLLGEETAYLALYQGAVRVADDCAGQPPRRERPALDTDAVPLGTLKRWLLHWVQSRHRDGAERTLRTAISGGATPTELRDLLFTAATERPYADGGHALDFCSKATEALDLVGWEYAGEILPSVLAQLVSARGADETSHWRYPVDVVPALEQAARDLPDLLARGGEPRPWSAGDPEGIAALADALLGDDPLAIIAALRDAARDGARPEDLSKALAYAAALRVARFGPANERGDWITVLHTFTYCNAVHQAVKRCPTPEVTRGVFHGAMAVYFDRFLNVPPARLPGERDGDSLEDEPTGGPALLERFLEALDGQQRVNSAARSVARYLRLGHPLPPLFDALTRAAVREDANFHTLQMLEAGVAQYREWEETPERAAPVLIAVARYLAAHAPTPRARLQTAQIALRLHRGDSLYEDSDA